MICTTCEAIPLTEWQKHNNCFNCISIKLHSSFHSARSPHLHFHFSIYSLRFVWIYVSLWIFQPLILTEICCSMNIMYIKWIGEECVFNFSPTFNAISNSSFESITYDKWTLVVQNKYGNNQLKIFNMFE